MLRWRLLSAGVIVCLLLALAILDYQQAAGLPPGAWLLLWLLIMTGLATEEMLSLLAFKDLRPVQWPVYVGTIGVSLAFALAILWSLWPAVSRAEPTSALSRPAGISPPLIALAIAVA